MTGPYVLPDGSAFTLDKMELPSDHWLYTRGQNVPPMPFRIGTGSPARKVLAAKVQDAARCAVRMATMNGADEDFDPDALVQNFIVCMLGYHTPDGLSTLSDNPDPIPSEFKVD